MSEPAVGAERAVLSACLQSPGALREARQVLSLTDFWVPANQVVFAVCCDLADAGTVPDPMLVLAELERRGDASRVGGAPYLHTLFSMPAVPGNVAHYAGEVRAAARRRQLVLIGTRLTQIAEEVPDLDDALTAAAREALALDLLVEETVDGPIDGLSTWDDFLAVPDRAEDWIVPGLLERGDVVMMLAKGGSGKSFLSRQFALAISAGVHPFKPHERIEPAVTLLCDLENPEQMVRRQTRPLQTAVGRLGEWSAGRAHIWAREGLDIRRRQDAQLLERVVAETRPKLVTIGSLWNLAKRGNSDWGTAAEETIAVLDRIRRRYRCAFLIEHHMPKGAENKTPYGGQEWERFVMFGRVIDRRGPNVWALETSFRSDRDPREWPAGLYRGGVLPWSPIFDEDELQITIEASS